MQSLSLAIAGTLLIVVAASLRWSDAATAQKGFEPHETTITEIHRAMRSGRLTSRSLVESYFKRISFYDQATELNGRRTEKLNAIVLINPQALADADRVDEEFRKTRRLRPLHGIPVIVKDNYNTKDLQTTAGSLAMKGSRPPDDAFQVRKLREAGAIVLAKSNMAEWAFSPLLTESSIAGVTRNPYDLERVPAGSSGGTAAAVASSFGAVGLGTDTGNSIRGPSSHSCLVGIRSTMGLTSRDGIIPLYLRNDIGGPMARTVEDAVRVFEVIAGYDPADPITKLAVGKVKKSYLQFLDRNGLKRARLGVFRRYIDAPTADAEIRKVTAKAIEDLKAHGATIIDPVDLPNYTELVKDIWCNAFHYDVNNYLASLGDRARFKNLTGIVESGLFSPYIERRLRDSIRVVPTSPPCQDVYHDPRSIAFRDALLKLMSEQSLDAIIYPTWSNVPRKVGDLQSPGGDNSQMLSPQTGFPAVTVPMGFTYGSLPAGLTFLGRLFSEGELIRFAYAYEQATRHRRPPANFPRLSSIER